MATEPREHHWKKFPSSAPRMFPGMPVQDSAERIVAHANEPDLLMPDDAPTDADSDAVRQRGFEEGFAAGRAEAEQLVRSEQQELLQTLQASAQEATRLRGAVIAQTLQDMAQALQLLFELVFGHELATNPVLLHNLAGHVEQALQKEGRLQLAMATADYVKASELLAHSADVDLVEDANLAPGAVRGTIGRAVYEMDVFKNLGEVLASAARDIDADRVEMEIQSLLGAQVASDEAADLSTAAEDSLQVEHSDAERDDPSAA